jgi:Tfp pilus assembly protein PilO
VNRRIAMFAGGAMVVLLGVWFLLLWSPKGSELSDAREQKAAAEQQVTELQVKLDRLKDAQRRSPELLAARDRLVSAIPEHAQLAEFILDANDAASKANVDFVSITPSPPGPSVVPGGPTSVKLRLAVTGDYFATLEFLDLLADLPRMVVLDQVKLNPTDDGKLSADLGGNIFTSQAPVAPGGVATTTTTTTTTVKP